MPGDCITSWVLEALRKIDLLYISLMTQMHLSFNSKNLKRLPKLHL